MDDYRYYQHVLEAAEKARSQYAFLEDTAEETVA
jgi:hypothetical protein